jgi:hypothetical protein
MGTADACCLPRAHARTHARTQQHSRTRAAQWPACRPLSQAPPAGCPTGPRSSAVAPPRLHLSCACRPGAVPAPCREGGPPRLPYSLAPSPPPPPASPPPPPASAPHTWRSLCGQRGVGFWSVSQPHNCVLAVASAHPHKSSHHVMLPHTQRRTQSAAHTPPTHNVTRVPAPMYTHTHTHTHTGTRTPSGMCGHRSLDVHAHAHTRTHAHTPPCPTQRTSHNHKPT